MKTELRLIIIVLISIFMVNPVFSRKNVEIDYKPVRIIKGNNNLPVELTISNFSGIPIQEVVVHYRYSGEGRFNTTRLNNDGYTYYASLNINNSSSSLVEYYFNIHYMDNRHQSFPAGAPLNNMLRTAIQQMRNYGDDIVIISPEVNEQIFANDIVITASFTRIASMVDVEKTKLYLNTWDVSQYLQSYGDFISFAPQRVPSGSHKVRLELYDESATLVASREWEFIAIRSRTTRAAENELKLSGRIFGEARTEYLQDADVPEDYNQTGIRIRGEYDQLVFGGRLYLSNQENSSRQPVNRYAGFARYNFWNDRYINIDFGDSYPKFNPLLLQHILVRGFHSTLFLKFLNIDVAYGKTMRSIEGEAHTESDTSTTAGGEIMVVDRFGTYQRNIFAIRPSFGEGEKFQLGFTYLKGRDDPGSINYGSFPEENAAAGVDLFLGFDNQRVIFEGNINGSAFNRNIEGGSIPFDTLQSKVEGVSDSEERFYNLAKKFITVNQYLILRPGLAYQARFRFRYFRNNLSFMYESVDEDFFSLGQPYLLRDNRGFHITDNISLLQNKLFLTLGYRDYHNNLQDSKANTTNIRNIYINASYFPLENFPEITVGYNNYTRNNDVPEDSINSVLNRPEDNQTNSLNFSTGYRFNVMEFNNRIGLNLMSYRRTDIFKFAEGNSNYLAIDLKTQYQFPLQTQLEFILQQTETGKDTLQSNLDMTSIGLGARYSFTNLFTTDQLMLMAKGRFGSLSSKYQYSSPLSSAPDIEYNRNYFSFRINYSQPRLGNLSLMLDILSYSGDRKDSDYIYSARYEYDFR